jgi:hypothetical protein
VRKACYKNANQRVERSMQIKITRKEARNLLTCVRKDGTSMTAELGPGLPHHDLAHYVVERKLGLTGGFFGKIAEGYTVAQLSDKDIIKTLGAQTLIAEVVARALQSLSSGACTADQFMELINAELVQWRIPELAIVPSTISEMSVEFRSLVERYSAVKNGEFIELQFPDLSSANKPLHVLGSESR